MLVVPRIDGRATVDVTLRIKPRNPVSRSQIPSFNCQEMVGDVSSESFPTYERSVPMISITARKTFVPGFSVRT
jgi:hypothetical protein